MTTRALFISGSLGLGHAVRDLAIANELRLEIDDLEISWLAADPASKYLADAGESLLPEAQLYANDNVHAEGAAKNGYKLNLQAYTMAAMDAWKQNVGIFNRVKAQSAYDLVIADEAYEISVALSDGEVQLDVPFVMLYDFVGNFAMTWNPMELLGTYMWNREWAKIPDDFAPKDRIALFLGEPGDVPNRSMGPFLPNARELAERVCEFTGYVLPFDPQAYSDQAAVKAKLGYSEGPLVIAAIGGTSVGKDLLTLCGEAYRLVKSEIPDLRMILIAGPRLAAESLDVPEGIEVRGYVPQLYEHFAACDLAIVQSGGGTTLELTALRRPFLYFPLEGHFEQQVHVAQRLSRHRAGVKMVYRKTTPADLAKQIASHIGQDVNCASISTDGAQKAAQLISQLL